MRQHEQILRYAEVKANLTKELYHRGDVIQSLEGIQQEFHENMKTLAIKVSEVAGLRKTVESLRTEIFSLKEELDTRKVEVSYIGFKSLVIMLGRE